MRNDKEWVFFRDANLFFIDRLPLCPKADRGKESRKIINLLCALDIETSTIDEIEQAYIYHWQCQLGFEMPTIYGRTSDELLEFLQKLSGFVSKGKKLLIFVHALSYEFHFIRGLFDDIGEKDVFAVSSRKPVKLKLFKGAIEFRCSYILTNMSLGQWTKKMKVEHAKKDSDEYDHTTKRYPWSELTEQELEYCRNDVLGLIEALQMQLSLYDDTLSSLPLTSTGYVRRDTKRTMKGYSFPAIKSVQPSPAVYVALREAFRGGNVHGNRFYVGQIVSGAHSSDRSSSYPTECCNSPFPSGPFRRSLHNDPDKAISRGKAVLMRVRLIGNIRLRNKYNPAPYLPIAKCRRVGERECIMDNGRILEAPFLETTLTDIDYKIITRQYVFDRLEVLDMWEANYDFLPDVLRNLIVSYYRMKTQLKGVAGQEVYYDKVKALLNSIYGLHAQDPCRLQVKYHHNLPGDNLFTEEEGDIAELLRKAQEQPYTSYSWGVFCTAHAREALQIGIELAGDDFLYADTDSVKAVSKTDFTEYNRRMVQESTESGAFADDPNGERHYMGVYEYEGRYDRFITYGAKKYAFEKDGKLGITIAGVNKQKGAEELAERGGLEALKPGFTFYKGGGTESKYNDVDFGIVPVDGRHIHIYPNIYIGPSTYKLKASHIDMDFEEMRDILTDYELFKRIYHERNIKQHLTK